ncbi:PfkB family carbohydrate kinase [Rubrolithibacter danxiaensis]|uniref:PfkB family carbohydrate kinase n=1 Tax=Rubrolithibacter danxiaensis TaxID=3390805 RepID=UPI003BF772C5
MPGKVLSFGELLLRITPDANGEWLNENLLPFFVGGAELNVATALALWGVPSEFLTAVPDNSVTQQIEAYLDKKNIQTGNILHRGDRLGLYYLTKGKDLKNAAVIYDRKGSSFSELNPGDIDWDKAFEGVSWFHFSAICPAINQQVADVCLEAVRNAAEKNITISLDLNYREKLWKYGKAPSEIMPELANYCNIIMGNIWAEHRMLGIPLDQDLSTDSGKDFLVRHSRISSEAISNQFAACTAVANTFRFDQGQGIRYYTTLYQNKELICSTEYIAESIVDKVGSGDCFMAGIIYGFYNQQPVKEILEFATAAAFNKLFINADATTNTVEEILETKRKYAE